MKTNATKWILASACAALIAATAQAAPPNPRDSRHPDPRGRAEWSRPRRAPGGSFHRRQPSPPRYYHPAWPPPPTVYWGCYPPPPPPPVVYCPPPPPRPVLCYPVRPGFNIVLTF